MALYAPSLTRILPLTRLTAQMVREALLDTPTQCDLVEMLHTLEAHHLSNAPEEDIPHFQRPLLRVVLRVETLWSKGGGLFATVFVHPGLERLYIERRLFDAVLCTIRVTDTGIVLEGRSAYQQPCKDFKPWCVELPFVDESLKTIGENSLPILLDPEVPQEPDFIRRSLVQLEAVFARQPEDLFWTQKHSWCRLRFVDEDGEVACTELFPGAWIAVQTDTSEALLICSAQRFQLCVDVSENALFFQTPSTFGLRLNYSSRRREALWSVAFGVFAGDPAHQELESTSLLLRTLIRDKRANHAQADALLPPVAPRPFLYQRYL